MEWEQLAARELGLNWTVELWSEDLDSDHQCHRTFPSPYTGLIGRRLFLHHRLRKICDEFDTIIVRHAPLDIFAPLLPTRIKKKCWHAFHTRTNDYLVKLGAVKGQSIAVIDRFLTRRATTGIRGLIAMTGEIAQEEMLRSKLELDSVIIAPNGIYKADWESPPTDRRSGPLKIVFIASRFYEWNGLEKLLQNATSDISEYDWQLHLVGRLTDMQLRMIERSPFKDRTYTHGIICSEDLDLLLTKMDLSLGAFALETLNMREACTLKVRESLGAGIPVYSGHRDSGLPVPFEYYVQGGPDLSKAITIAAKMRGEERRSVISKSREFIDKNYLLKQLAERISNLPA